MKISNNEFASQQIRQFGRLMEDIQSNQEKISSGQRINRPSDAPVDATRLSIANHMKSRVDQYRENSQTAETKLRRYDIAYKDISNLMTRIKELAIQAANDSSSDQDRKFIATEINGLKENILAIANSRDDNGQYIFGGFNSEEPAFVEKKPKPNLVHTKKGSSRVALSPSTAPPINTTTADEDIVISGIRGTRTIDVSATDSAKTVAAAINKFAPETGVAATAKTYARISSTRTSNATNNLNINGFSTGNFSISSDSVSDAVTKINAITANTGVAAKAYELSGSYLYTGTTRAALPMAPTAAANTTTANEDIVILGNGITRTIDVGANESAQQVAAKINVETGNTGVAATAKTYAKLAAEDNPPGTFNISINGVTTGNFLMGSNSVSTAVSAINAISGSSGVTAEASPDGTFVTLHNAQGADIIVENNDSHPHLDIWAVAYDGVTVSGAKQNILASGSNDATRIIGTINLNSSTSFTITQQGNPANGYFSDGAGKTEKYVQLYNSQGADITVENNSTDPLIDVYALEYDGVKLSGSKQDLAPSGGNDATRIIGNINLSSPSSYTVTQLGNEAKGYFSSGRSGLTETSGTDETRTSKIEYVGSPGRRDVQVSETRILSVQEDGYEGFLRVKLDDGSRSSIFELIDETVKQINSSNNPSENYKVISVASSATSPASSASSKSITAAEDFILKVGLLERTIDVVANESAQSVASKVNAITGDTQISAKAKTYAKFLSKGPVRNYSIKVNGTSTGDFSISKTSVGDAITKINAISSTTGVKATASHDGTYITLLAENGADITVENESTGVDLEVTAIGYDGKTTSGEAQNLEASGAKDATRVAGNLQLGAPVEFSVTQSGTDSLGYFRDETAKLSTVSARVSQSLFGLTSSLEHISQRHASVGARMQTVVAQSDILDNRLAVLQKDISDLRDADIAKLVIELQNSLTTLEAAQLAYSKITQISLFDFLR